MRCPEVGADPSAADFVRFDDVHHGAGADGVGDRLCGPTGTVVAGQAYVVHADPHRAQAVCVDGVLHRSEG